MELRTLSIDTAQQKTRVWATHPERVFDGELGHAATARILEAAQPLLTWLQETGRLAAGELFTELWLDADNKELAVRWGDRLEALDYFATQTLVRELARTARREVVARKPDPPGLPPTERWEYLYHHGGDGWEMGRATPPLERYFSAQPPTAGERALVVGCGRGHEALLLARVGAAGSQVVGIDLAPAAVKIAQGLADEAGLSNRLSYQVQDLFALPLSDPSQCGRYDLLVEHNCFCAIEPEHRPQYVEAVSLLLRPGGRLVGLFYTHNYPGGPPYASSAEEIRSRLLPAFDITHEEVPTDSAITRAGLELLLVAVRR